MAPRLSLWLFYNMLAHGKPVEKALTLLRFTQRSNGKQHAHGFRIITERTQEATAGAATEPTKENSYATVALCTVEKVPDFSAGKDTTFIAVICKVVAPSKPSQPQQISTSRPWNLSGKMTLTAAWE